MTATDELMALLAKAGFTRLVADYLPENEEGFPVCWRIHDHPDNSHVANMICDGIENEDEAAAIVAAVNFCRTELPALIAEVERLREALRELAAAGALGAAMSVDDGEAFAMIEHRARAALGVSHDGK